jgi:hypothetical protein
MTRLSSVSGFSPAPGEGAAKLMSESDVTTPMARDLRIRKPWEDERRELARRAFRGKEARSFVAAGV